MSSTPVSIPLSNTQEALTDVMKIAAVAAAPFIKSANGQATEQLVLSEAGLFIQALPLLKDVFESLGFSKLANLFHHTNQTVQAAQATSPAVKQ